MNSSSNDVKCVGGSNGIKKRGRKPKGGKIIPIHQNIHSESSELIENIILHLKCSRIDINACDNFTLINPLTIDESSFQPQIQKQKSLTDYCKYNYNYVTPDTMNEKPRNTVSMNSDDNNDSHMFGDHGNDNQNDSDKKMLLHIQKKLHEIQYNYRNNTNYNTHSVCFWCTCEFNNDPIYIPRNVDPNGTFNVYGHFCMLECALAYLMNEHIDSSVKYERSALLHYKYKDSYDCNNGIKPAPSPHYILNKFYGNLSIEEYRMLYKTSKLVMVINKPITKIFPEIHEDNVDFVMKSKTIPAHNDGKIGCKFEKTSYFSNFVIVQ